MRIYYKVVFTRNNCTISKRFSDPMAASRLCDKVGGFIRVCSEKIRADFGRCYA